MIVFVRIAIFGELVCNIVLELSASHYYDENYTARELEGTYLIGHISGSALQTILC